MRVIFRLLSRRWLGVTGWVYLFSLTLAALMYWMLPASSLVYRWTFSGAYNIDGFSKVDRLSIIVSRLTNRDERFQLDTVTGSIKRCVATGEESHQAISSRYLPFQLSHTLSWDLQSMLILKNERDGTERNISFKDCEIYLAGLYAGNGSSMKATISLSTSGLAAMSSDERWLILLSRRTPCWVRLKNWLTESTGWSLSFLPNHNSNTGYIVDLQTNQITICDLSTCYTPELVIHPENSGFAVADLELDGKGAPDLFSNQTIVSWYALPPGPTYHTRSQWLIILGTLLAPILLAMLSHLFRRQKPISNSAAHLIR